jgi:hypothetical protein
MVGCPRRTALGQRGRLQSLAQPTRRPERLRQTSGLQRTLRAAGFNAHVRAPTRLAASGVDDDDAVGATRQPHELALCAPLPTPQARAVGHMLHVPVDGGATSSPADTADAGASGAGSARAASHS